MEIISHSGVRKTTKYETEVRSHNKKLTNLNKIQQFQYRLRNLQETKLKYLWQKEKIIHHHERPKLFPTHSQYIKNSYLQKLNILNPKCLGPEVLQFFFRF